MIFLIMTVKLRLVQKTDGKLMILVRDAIILISKKFLRQVTFTPRQEKKISVKLVALKPVLMI